MTAPAADPVPAAGPGPSASTGPSASAGATTITAAAAVLMLGDASQRAQPWWPPELALAVVVLVLSAVPVWVAWLGWCFSGFGIGLAYPTQSVLLLELSPAREQGRNSSALQLNETLTVAGRAD